MLTTVTDRDLDRLVTVGVRAGEGYTARVWDTASWPGKLLFSSHPCLTDTRTVVLGLDISPDGTKVATGSGTLMPSEEIGKVVLWDLSTGVPYVMETAPEYVWGVKLSPDGSALGPAAFDDGSAHIYDVTNRKLLYILSGHTAALRSVDFNQDGTRLPGNRRFRQYGDCLDANTGQQVLPPTFACSAGIWDVKFNPDGSQIAVFCSDMKTRLLDASTGQEWLTFPGRVVFSPDGKYLIT